MGTDLPPKLTYALSPDGAQLLKDAQRANGPSLELLGDATGSSKALISQVLNGKQTTFDALPRLCKELGVDVVRVVQGIPRKDADFLALWREFCEFTPDLAKGQLEIIQEFVKMHREIREQVAREFPPTEVPLPKSLPRPAIPGKRHQARSCFPNFSFDASFVNP